MKFYETYNLGVSAKSGPGFPLQSFFRTSKKDFRYNPSRKFLFLFEVLILNSR